MNPSLPRHNALVIATENDFNLDSFRTYMAAAIASGEPPEKAAAIAGVAVTEENAIIQRFANDALSQRDTKTVKQMFEAMVGDIVNSRWGSDGSITASRGAYTAKAEKIDDAELLPECDTKEKFAKYTEVYRVKLTAVGPGANLPPEDEIPGILQHSECLSYSLKERVSLECRL